MVFKGRAKFDERTLAYVNENDGYILKTLYLSVFFAIFSGGVFYYAAYVDAMWKDVFAFSYTPQTWLALEFFIVGLVGVAIAILLSKSIKSRDFILTPNIAAIHNAYLEFVSRIKISNIIARNLCMALILIVIFSCIVFG